LGQNDLGPDRPDTVLHDIKLPNHPIRLTLYQYSIMKINQPTSLMIILTKTIPFSDIYSKKILKIYTIKMTVL
jgi:hypothetical protein